MLRVVVIAWYKAGLPLAMGTIPEWLYLGHRCAKFNGGQIEGSLCLMFEMQIIEGIAWIALLLSVLSVIYARLSISEAQKANAAATRANEIAIHNEMRNLRRSAYNHTREFLHFCVTYETQRQLQIVTRAIDLIRRLDEFREQIAQLGPLDMAPVEQSHAEIISHTWALQRVIDRLEGPENPDRDGLMQELHDLLEWFADQERELMNLFREFLAPYT